MENKKHCNLDIYDLVFLIRKYKKNELSNAEEFILNEWLSCDPRNKILLHRITEQDSLEAINYMLSIDTKQRLLDLNSQLSNNRKNDLKWLRYTAAACVAFVIAAVSIYTIMIPKEGGGQHVSQVETEDSYFHKEQKVLFIDGQKSQVFKLAHHNGEIELNSFEEGQALSEVDIEHSNPNLSKIVTPKGVKIKFHLQDGTLVHLNSNSELSFNSDIQNDKHREVWLNGEAYFEVVHNKTPFIVHMQDDAVEVLGTKFNIDTYESSGFLQVNLLEGSVSVSIKHIGSDEFLVPGNQLTYDRGNKRRNIKNIPIARMAPWLKDVVIFESQTIQEITRKLSNWYDVEFVMDENPPISLFTAELSLREGLTSLLTKLEMTEKVRFDRLSGNKIRVRKL